MPRIQGGGANDPRCGFIASASATLAGRSESDVRKGLESGSASKQVASFLDDPSCLCLGVSVYQDGRLVVGTFPDLAAGSGSKKSADDDGGSSNDKIADVVFIKTRPEPVTEANLHDVVQVSSIQAASPLSSFYHTVHQVYGPLLLRTPEWSAKLSTGLQQLLADLDTKLQQESVRQGPPSGDSRGDAASAAGGGSSSFSNVLSVVDEIDFWDHQSARGNEGEAISIFREALQPIRQDWSDLHSLEMEGVESLLEGTHAALDDLWRADLASSRYAYSQARMLHTLDMVSGGIIQYVQRRLGGHELWSEALTGIRSLLKSSATLLERWGQMSTELTGSVWPSHDKHPWKGAGYNNGFVASMAQRLAQILELRVTHEELVQLLSASEAKELKVDRCFSAFEGVNPLLYNPYTQPVWEAALHEYERTLGPIEQHVSANFRRKVTNLLGSPMLLLQEFERFASLLDRPRIRELLAHERETLLAQLVEHVDQMEAEFDRRASSSKGQQQGQQRGKNLSAKVSAVVFARQLKARLSGIFGGSSALVKDLPGFKAYEGVVRSLQEKLSGQEADLFEAWLRDVEDMADNGELGVQVQGRLMEINHAGILTVNYSERLVTLLREYRQLSEMGFAVSEPIAKVVAEGERYYRYGVMLKKVATFYNSLEGQIIDSQKPMLLDALLAFEEVVANPSAGWKAGSSKGGGGKGAEGGAMAITWANPAECQNYVDRLLKAADRLAGENRKLRRAHATLAREVSGLMALDLLRSREQWKAKWQGVRDVVAALQARMPPERMGKWLSHWDQQVYKALEAGYQMGLESLNENLGEIRCDLCLSNRALVFKPAFEELRMVYYREMKKFVAIPNAFEGLQAGGGAAALYRRMVRCNVSSLTHVYDKTEELFGQLALLRERYDDWTALAAVDLDVFVEETVGDTTDYETNFKAVKARRKDCERLPDFEKVDCFRVSVTPLKQSVEDLLQRLNDALMLCLRKRILSAINEVDRYLEGGMEKLSRRPRSVEDISQAKADWKELDGQREAMKRATRELLDSKRVLLQYAPGSSSIDTSEVVSRAASLEGEGGRWDGFEIALDAYNEMIEEQKEALRGLIDEQVTALAMSMDKFGQRWAALKPQELKSWEAEDVARVFASLDDWGQQFADLRKKAAELADNCSAFAMPAPRFDGLDATEADLARTAASWQMLRDYNDEMGKLGGQDWISFRANIFALQDVAGAWQDRVKEKFADGSHDFVTQHLQEQLERVRKALPALKYCRGEPFKDEHWGSLLQGKLQLPKGLRLESLTVGHFLSRLDVLAEPGTLTFVKHLQARAQGEVTIREAMQELVAWSQTAELKLTERAEGGSRRTMLIRDWKELVLELGDKQSLLASLKESQFFKAFADQGATYEVKLAALDHHLTLLNAIQRKWVYLEPIFARGSLPSEQARFRRVDEQFREIMSKVESEPKLFNLADEDLFPRLRDSLGTMQDQLERCQKALADFLEEKRSAMPRFYFIGDDDLLEILGQAKNPVVLQSHLKKLFQGLHRVELNEAGDAITAMLSSAKEAVPLQRPVRVSDRVEEWLEQLVAEMRSTLAAQLQRCLDEKELDLERYPSQVLCLAEQVKFTQKCEAAIRSGGGSSLSSLSSSLQDLLSQYTRYDLSGQPLLQLKVKALVLDVVHAMDVVAALQAQQVRGLDDWVWRKQLRFYSSTGAKPASIRMSDAEFSYSYEYQGNAAKLVHTALTDRCYLTLTQAVDMGFGGNPYGPAGTGKTESVKALGQAFGRQVLVFNCDEGIDFQSMGRIFIGLVKCGAWGCFDEFNRLKEDQLSAISQQIQVIQDGIKAKLPRITLLGRTIDVDLNAGIFVTLNPAGKEYGGRSKLPDNLKALFRPIAMGRPDNDVIAEVILYSEGFKQAKELAGKIVSLFTLSRQLLSTQQHYDWGLRALKAVLNTGGKLTQAAKREGQAVPPQREKEILIKAVRVNTLSKLTYGDTRRFLTLIGDVFPGVESSDMSGGELEAALREVMAAKPFLLEPDETQIRKMLQLREALEQRMGCVIVGPSGCGKSTVWRVLQAALIKCGRPVVTHVVNPKAMPRQQLLGSMDLDTREWCDGVLTDAARKVVREPPEVNSWIVCDGDIDPEWIESLNSVLDDNHLLTLPNGERISFGPNVNFVFETHSLSFASPATVSRMGMIFLSDEDVNLKRLVTRWVHSQPEEQRSALTGWIDDLFYKALRLVLQREAVVETTMVGTVMNGLSQVAQANSKGEFVCGLIRGLGANLSLQDRVSFAKEVFQWAGERPPDMGAPLDCCYERGGFRAYVTARGREEDGQALSVEDVLGSGVVSTVSVQRTMRLLSAWIDAMEPFVLVGPEGCGKNMIIQHAFAQRRGTTVATLHCNARTTAAHVITKIAQACSLFSSPDGRVYRPRDGERLVLYLKDINLPKPDQYDSCMLIAFLQQLITFGGFYNSSLEFLRLERVQLVASMNAATTVGRHPLSTRFTAIVRLGVMDYPDTAELTSVYDSYLEPILTATCDASPTNTKFAQPSTRQKLAATLVELFESTRSKFTVDDQRHYIFTPRDLTGLVRGLLRYDANTESLLDYLANEACGVFRDRLVDAEAEAKFDSLLHGLLRSQWRHSSSGPGFYTTLTTTGGGSKGREEGGGARADPQLTRVSPEDFVSVVRQGLMYYEREETELNMLLFPEVLANLARVDRVLSRGGGQLFLVGRSGVGKRTVTLLVAYMLRYKFVTPALTRGYGLSQFMADLKGVVQTAGIEGEDVVLFLDDHRLTSNAVVETLNSLLSAGEVPGLYTHEELEPLLAPLRERAAEDGTHKTVYDFFVSRVKRHLHVVLSMDATNPTFLARCEANPALYTRCDLVWMGEWRKPTMLAIPGMVEGVKGLLQMQGAGRGDGKDDDDDEDDDEEEDSKYDLGGGKKKKKKRGGGGGKRQDRGDAGGSGGGEGLVEAVVGMHEACKDAVAATPREYVTFLQTWCRLHDEKREGLGTELKHLKAGLDKLQNAAKMVDELSRDASVQQKELQSAQVAADRAMEQITRALSEATERRREVEELKVELARNEQATQDRKAQIETELASITPVLEAAKQAVGQIRSDHLNEIRSLIMPPEAIADVLSAVLMLLGINDTSWLSMKKFLMNRGVKDEILNFDAHRITPEIRKAVSNHVRQKQSSFEKENITRVSVAAAPLAIWVKANIKYSIVLEKLEPLEQELAAAESVLQKSQQRLDSCEAELTEIDDKVRAMKHEFAERTREAERLRAGLERAQATLDKAQHLLGQLGGERERWQQQERALRQGIATLPVQMLLAAAFTTYLAQAAEDTRERVLQACLALCKSQLRLLPSEQPFSYRRLMSSESQLLTWKAEGLPSDSLSQENAIVVANAGSRVPFIIDPASAATAWLRSYLSKDPSRPLEVVQSQDARFTNQVELAVRFGKTLLVLDVDGLEPLLYPLARRELAHQGARWVVQVGDKTIDYNESFRMVLVTRDPDPELPPDAAALVVQVNFTVTRSGLEGQLLGVTIQHEQPELEAAKTEMLRQEEALKVQLAGLEKDLLEALATSEGNILENTSLIESLTKTKAKAADITQALETSARTSAELDRQRDSYRSFAQDGSRLYFLLTQLSALSPMYQFSLASFVALFRATLAEKMKAADVSDRLARLKPELESRVYLHVARAVFKDDRPMLALHLVRGMYGEDLIEGKQWDFFLGRLPAAIADGSRPRDLPTWASSDRGAAFRCLSENFPRLLSALELGNDGKWSRWATSPECERDFPPLRSVTAFEKVMVVQTLRPDRLQSALQQFAAEVLRLQSLSPPAMSFASIYEAESCATSPILFLTSAGADPSKELAEYAAKVVGRERYQELAMGGGQQEVALTLLRQAAQAGDWLCLKNLHLVVAWLPVFEKEVLTLQPHPDFRLWLTTEPHPAFPAVLLQASLKLTFESPPGIKKTLQRIYGSTWSPEYVEGGGGGSVVRTKLLFLLAWFHAIVQERRTYLPQGWTKFYEFSGGDLRAGSYVIEAAVKAAGKGGQPDWDTIRGLMEDAIYGGRIDNPYDMRVMRTYLHRYFSSDMIARNGGDVIKGVAVPDSSQNDDFLRLIQQLPDSDPPFTFGLPDNIERSVQRARSSAVILQLKTLGNTFMAEAKKFDREAWRAGLSPLLDLWQKLTSSSPDIGKKRDAEEVGKASQDRDPVDGFALMEDGFAAGLCFLVDNSLTAIKKVVFGSGLLTPAVQATAGALLADRIPSDWRAQWEGPVEHPQGWLRALVQRRLALARLCAAVAKRSLLSQPINLSDLFNPGTFLNALRQQTSRQIEAPLDQVKMVCAWEASRLKSAALSVTLEGLLLQGAIITGSNLAEPPANAAEVVTVPPLHIAFVRSKDPEPYEDRQTVALPLYLTTSREKFVVELVLPTEKAPEKWILAGTALFLSDDE